MTERKYATFLVRGNIDANSKEMTVVSELNEILRKMGSEISVKPTADENFSYLTIIFDTEKTHDFLSRGAGRKPKSVHHTIAEVREMLAHESSAVVAHRLGISKATLYRRLKRYSEELRGFPELEHEWYF